MTDDEWNDIRPGATVAKELGCKCPVEQPNHEPHRAYTMSWGCDLHQAHRFRSMKMVDELYD